MSGLDAWLQESAEHGVIGVYVASRKFGLPIRTIREITGANDITVVPRSSALVVGLVNLRGQIVTVVNPAVRLGITGYSDGETKHLIVFKTNSELSDDCRKLGIRTCDEPVALLVDRVSEVYYLTREEFLAPPPNIDSRERQHILGVCKTGHQTMVCLIPPGLIQPDAFVSDTWSTDESKRTATSQGTS